MAKTSSLNRITPNIAARENEGNEDRFGKGLNCLLALHKKSQIRGSVENLLTLKALANVSPGFALKPWVQKCSLRLFATLKGLRGFPVSKHRRNSFRVAPSRNEMPVPRVAKAQPWAGIGERFQRGDGENNETDSSIDFAIDCGYIERREHGELVAECREIGKMLGSMIGNPTGFLIIRQRRGF